MIRDIDEVQNMFKDYEGTLTKLTYSISDLFHDSKLKSLRQFQYN